MKALTTLPPGYTQQTVFNSPLRNWKLLAAAIVSGIVLLITTGWLLVQLIDTLRPEALAGIRFSDMLTTTANGTAFNLPFSLIRDFVIATGLVLIIHELVHGLFFWLFSGKRPRFGIKGIAPYAAAPPGVYFPRNQVLVVGLAPLLLLTLVGILLMLIVPVQVVPILLFFVALNASGSTMDLLMVISLLSFSADTLVENRDMKSIIYHPAGEATAA
jgi:hypothetical protein